MKKKFWLGMLVMTLVLGLAVVGCDNSSEDDNNNGNNKEESINLPSTSGEFTLTGIPSKYNGKFAILEGSFSNSSRLMIGFKGVTKNTSNPNYFSTMTCVKIENGTVKAPLYTFLQSSPVSTIQAYTGNDSTFVDILIYNSEVISTATWQSYIDYAIFGTSSGATPITFPIQFTNGKASISNNDATKKLE